MPGVNEKLAYDKTFDILDFAIAGGLSLGFFLLNWFGMALLLKFSKKVEFSFARVLLLIFSLITFLQTHFLVFASKQVLVMVLVFEALFFAAGLSGNHFNLTSWILELKKPVGKLRLQNGIFLGFLFLLITNVLTTIPILSLSWLFVVPFLALVSKNKKVNSVLESFPGALSLLAIFSPNNLTWIFGLLFVLFIGAVAISKRKRNPLLKNWVTSFLNPALIIFLVTFNPAFNIGDFDTVEEGFWLAWVQRLIGGDVLYRDAAVYHPPLIPWGMYFFSKLNGFNLYSERLFLHLLQISGFLIYFFFAKKIIKNSVFAILSFFVFLAVTATLVRNNIEIRIGLPLLSLLVFFYYFQFKKLWLLFLSGVIAAISLLTSIESGIAVIIALFLGFNIFAVSKFLSLERVKENLFLFAEIGGTLGIFIIYLSFNGALPPFLEQTSFYASSFSKGYFNSSLERSVAHSYFHFDVFDEYLDSVTIFWESTKLIFFGFIIYGFYKFIAGLKVSTETAQVLITSIFGLILTRAALGRSDWYHLLFVSGIALILIFYALSKLQEIKKILAIGLTLFIILVAVRPSINNSFLEKQFFKFETYGKIFGEYRSYKFERGEGALIGMEIDTQPMDDLVGYVQMNSSGEDKIFVFPWNPEVYFYTDRTGATKFDTPYAFFSKNYQDQMISELKNNKPKFIVLDANMNFGGLTTGTLSNVTEFISANYKRREIFGPFELLVPN